MAVSANRLELLQIADAVAREKAIDRKIVLKNPQAHRHEGGRTLAEARTVRTYPSNDRPLIAAGMN